MDNVTTLDEIEPITEAPVRAGLSAISIAKSYDKRTVLTDVSVSVGRGEVVGLLGPNGAGKTTCFYSVMGLVKPDSGRVLLDGEDRSEEHTSELQSLMRISYAVFCLKKKTKHKS